MEKLMRSCGFALAIVMASVFVGCEPLDEETVEFSMQVIPESIEDSVPGQRCVFLVTVQDEEDAGKEVNISATAEGAAVTVNPQAITPGQVAEVTVIPDELVTVGVLAVPVEDDTQPVEPEPYAGGTLTVNITGEREGLEQTETVTVVVSEAIGPDGLSPTAVSMRDRFIPWLAANHPELGITSETEWIGSIVRPHILGVMYYLFFSEEWEMGLRWHVMIPPYDWAEIYLRRRGSEVVPSYAFKIASLDAQDEPQAVDLPESVWR